MKTDPEKSGRPTLRDRWAALPRWGRTVLLLAFVAALLAGGNAWYRGRSGPRVAVLEGLAFEEGEALVALDLKWENADRIASRVGDFYVAEPDALRRMAGAWITGGPAPFFLCGYNYNLYVLSPGKPPREYSVNLESGCNTIVGRGRGAYWFPPALITRFERDYKKPRVEKHAFADLKKARTFLEEAAKRPDYLLHLPLDPPWRRFEGTFEFEHVCPAENADSIEDCLASAVDAVRGRYPGAEFDSRWREHMSAPGGTAKQTVELTATRAFADRFDLAPKKNPFKPLEAELRLVLREL